MGMTQQSAKDALSSVCQSLLIRARTLHTYTDDQKLGKHSVGPFVHHPSMFLPRMMRSAYKAQMQSPRSASVWETLCLATKDSHIPRCCFHSNILVCPPTRYISVELLGTSQFCATSLAPSEEQRTVRRTCACTPMHRNTSNVPRSNPPRKRKQCGEEMTSVRPHGQTALKTGDLSVESHSRDGKDRPLHRSYLSVRTDMIG